MSYSSEVLADSPVAWYRFNETGGTTAADSASTNTLTYTGTPTFGVTSLLPSDPDLAVSLPGSVYGANASPSGIPNAAPFTVEAFLSPSDLTAVHRWASNGGWGMGSNGGGLRFTTFSIQDYDTVGTSYLTLNTPHQVVVVFTNAFSALFYVDGVLKETITGASNPGVGHPFNVGGRDAGLETFIGVLDEVSFYATALSATRIAAHYSAATTLPQFVPQFNPIPFMR